MYVKLNLREEDHQGRLLRIKQLYSLLLEIELRIGGKRLLMEPDLRRAVPAHGIYFFFEPGEMRSDSGEGHRIVRIGTHGIIEKSKANLWDRLRAHRGHIKGRFLGGGNHRVSVFRKHIGTALIRRFYFGDSNFQTWGEGSSASRQIRAKEHLLEIEVSKYVCSMPFIWIAIRDGPRGRNQKKYIERNAIALLSNFDYKDYPIDSTSPNWLGLSSGSESIRSSGLWNINHLSGNNDIGFINEMERIIRQEREDENPSYQKKTSLDDKLGRSDLIGIQSKMKRKIDI